MFFKNLFALPFPEGSALRQGGVEGIIRQFLGVFPVWDHFVKPLLPATA